MAATAAIILAHDHPPQVRRLIRALAGVDLFLHCDRRAPKAVFRAMLAEPASDVQVVARRRTTRCSWSLVAAELAALRAALTYSRAEHIAVLSASCYPLVSTQELNDELAAFRGQSRFLLNPMPFAPWGTASNPDGGMWRLRRRFVTIRDQVVFVRGTPLRTFRRPIPGELTLMGSSQWKIYARSHVSALLEVFDRRPELSEFWRTTLVPDEICVASVLSSPPLVGHIALELRNSYPWVVKWGAVGPDGRPGWLGPEDLPMLEAARRTAPGEEGCKLFARKLPPDDTRLADLIDERLRS